MNAPDPTGAGAELAIRQALKTAGMAAADIGYAHLHGTATRLNDEMEAKVMHRLFGGDLACSSTKPFTGHLLGATGACQAIFCLLAMRLGYLPPHWWDGVQDPLLPVLRFVEAGERVNNLRAVLSASYAFGGNNIGLVFARA
jgi:3-oxoacyl-[acyl-carrier-protein] synthase-1